MTVKIMPGNADVLKADLPERSPTENVQTEQLTRPYVYRQETEYKPKIQPSSRTRSRKHMSIAGTAGVQILLSLLVGGVLWCLITFGEDDAANIAGRFMELFA